MIPANSAMGADAEAGAIATFLAFRQAISIFSVTAELRRQQPSALTIGSSSATLPTPWVRCIL
jgi:hypothetical protein